MYEYKWVNISLIPYEVLREPAQGATIEEAANYWASQGWRTVSVIPAKGPGYSDTLLIERKKESAPRRENRRQRGWWTRA